MKIIFDANKTEDGHTLDMRCTEVPEDVKETMYLKRAVAESLNSEISAWDEYLTSYTSYPSSYKVGGQKVEVRKVERCESNSVGECNLCAGYIEIAEFFNKDDRQSDDSKRNTFYHELVHTILNTMGKKELNSDEEFVCAFSSFLSEAMENAVFAQKHKP